MLDTMDTFGIRVYPAPKEETEIMHYLHFHCRPSLVRYSKLRGRVLMIDKHP